MFDSIVVMMLVQTLVEEYNEDVVKMTILQLQRNYASAKHS